MKKLLCSILLLLPFCAASCLFAQESDDRAVVYANLISAHDIERNVRVLTADGLEGRKTGEKGQKMAAFFIREQFIQAGLMPLVETNLGKTYFQQFELENSQILDFHVVAAKGEKITDFIPNPYSDLDKIDNITFRIIHDWKNISENNAGEAVVLLFDDTRKLTDAFWAEEFEKIAKFARSKNVRFLFFAVNNSEKFALTQKLFAANPHLSGAKMRLTGTQKLGTALMGSNGFKKIFGDTPAKIFEKNTPEKATLNIFVDKKTSITATENVVGFIPGYEFPDEVVVISSHYDHLGIDKDGQVFNGADDNASGICGMAEVAKAFGKAKSVGDFPRRSVLFIAYSGEEQGMLGSEFYTDFSPLFALDKTVLNLNADMIGREHTDTKFTADNYVSLVGSDWLSPDLHEISEAMNKKHVGLEFDYTYNDKNHPERYFYRSDQYNFAKYDIPVIFYTGPDHKDYHKVSDDADLLLYPRVEKISKLIFFTAWEVANREKRLQIKKID